MTITISCFCKNISSHIYENCRSIVLIHCLLLNQLAKVHYLDPTLQVRSVVKTI
jgi:hypothetical protein